MKFPKWREWFSDWYVSLAWILLIATVINWPLSVVTYAKDEPQTVLHLSWLAIFLTAVGILYTAKVRKKQDED